MRWSMVVILLTLAAYGLVKSDAQGTIAAGPSENLLNSFSTFFQDMALTPEPVDRQSAVIGGTTLVPMHPLSPFNGPGEGLGRPATANLPPGPLDAGAWTAARHADD